MVVKVFILFRVATGCSIIPTSIITSAAPIIIISFIRIVILIVIVIVILIVVVIVIVIDIHVAQLLKGL